MSRIFLGSMSSKERNSFKWTYSVIHGGWKKASPVRSHSSWIIVTTVAFLFLAQWSLIPNFRLEWANHGCQYPEPVISDAAPIKLEALNRTWTFAFQLALMWKGGTSRFESHPVWSSQLLAKRAGGRLSAFCHVISYSPVRALCWNRWCISYMSLRLHTVWKIPQLPGSLGIENVIFNHTPLWDPIPVIKDDQT